MNFNDTGVFGFDVSYWQDVNSTPQQIDFVKMRNYGASFVIVRAGQGAWPDPDFEWNWRESRAAGLPRSAYWFFDPRVSPANQADTFATLTRANPPRRLWVDLEFPAAWGGAYTDWRHWKSFIELTKEFSGLEIGVYTGSWWWTPNAVQKGADLAYFGQYPLWGANYTDNPASVPVPSGWSRMMIWQDGTPAIGREAGVESLEIDHNRWNSDFDFSAEWGLTATLPPPNGENPMAVAIKFKVTWDNGCNVRPAPTVNNSPVGVLRLGDVFEVFNYFVPDGKTEGQERWGQLTSGYWVALTYSSQPRAAQVLEPEPEPAPEPEPTTKTPFTLAVDGFKPYSGELEKA